ncbi:MAG: GTP cyclohydrolase IIa [Vulcanisaeta sp. AZ3]|jgi:GTP cyclohydrolase IIa
MFLNIWFNYVDGDKPLVQITIIRLIGYREWTESLGYDREHVIQGIQARVHGKLIDIFSKLGAWAHPFRYDYLLAVTNGINAEEIIEAVKALGEVSPVPPSSGTYVHENPRVAEREAFRLALRAGPWESIVDDIDNDPVGIAHIDLMDSTSSTEATSSYLLYEHVWSIVSQVRLYFAVYGGLTLYLGGDNIVSIIPPHIREEDLQPLINLYSVRIGVGIARKGREAMKLATEALDELRNRNSRGVLILRDKD